MIINYPTGLYRNVLPSKPSDGGNVTFTISNSSPPRTNLLFPKISRGVLDRKRSNIDVGLFARRQTTGELIFSVSSSSRSVEGNNSRTFEIGQILEFSDAPPQSIDPMFVSSKTEIQHNINRFDYASLGISESDIKLIEKESLEIKDVLTNRLNILRELRTDSETVISTQQKIINDSNRNINALQIILESSDETDQDIEELIQKFVSKRDQAFIDRDTAKQEANAAAAEASEILSKLRTISVVVK